MTLKRLKKGEVVFVECVDGIRREARVTYACHPYYAFATVELAGLTVAGDLTTDTGDWLWEPASLSEWLKLVPLDQEHRARAEQELEGIGVL